MLLSIQKDKIKYVIFLFGLLTFRFVPRHVDTVSDTYVAFHGGNIAPFLSKRKNSFSVDGQACASSSLPQPLAVDLQSFLRAPGNGWGGNDLIADGEPNLWLPPMTFKTSDTISKRRPLTLDSWECVTLGELHPVFGSGFDATQVVRTRIDAKHTTQFMIPVYRPPGIAYLRRGGFALRDAETWNEIPFPPLHNHHFVRYKLNVSSDYLPALRDFNASDLNFNNSIVYERSIDTLLPHADRHEMIAERFGPGQMHVVDVRLDNVGDKPLTVTFTMRTEWSTGVPEGRFVPPLNFMISVNRHNHFAYMVPAHAGQTVAWRTFYMPFDVVLLYYWEHMHRLAQEMWIVAGDAKDLVPLPLQRAYAPSKNNVTVTVPSITSLQQTLQTNGADIRCAFRNTHALLQADDPNKGHYDFMGLYRRIEDRCVDWRLAKGAPITVFAFNAESPTTTMQHTHFHAYFAPLHA